jgi:hypothetical protein
MGGFSEQMPAGVMGTPRAVVLADVDGDGLGDIVALGEVSEEVVVRRSVGDGTFLAAESYAVGPGPYDLVLVHLDGDAALDLAVANEGEGSVSVLMGDGTGASRRRCATWWLRARAGSRRPISTATASPISSPRASTASS